MADLRLTYYPDITQHRTPAEIRASVVAFADTLAAELSKRAGGKHSIPVLDVVSVADQTAMISDGRCEIALIKPSSYIYAHRRNPQVTAAAVALRMIDGKVGDTYYTQLYANVRSGIGSFADLERRCLGRLEQRPSIGFGDSFSTSNFLVPASVLVERGLHPLIRFRRVEFLGGHDGVARAVYKGEVDVGAGHDGVIVDLGRQPGYEGAGEMLVQLARRDMHSDPVAVHIPDDQFRNHLTDALIAIGERDEIKRHLDIFWGAVKGLGRTRHENYRSIEDALDSLNLPEHAVLGT